MKNFFSKIRHALMKFYHKGHDGQIIDGRLVHGYPGPRITVNALSDPTQLIEDSRKQKKNIKKRTI